MQSLNNLFKTALMLLLFLPVVAMSQSQPKLELNGHTWDLEPNVSTWNQLQATKKTNSPLRRSYWVAGFSEMPGSEEMKLMEANGLRLLEFYQNQAFLVSLSPDANLEVLEQAGLIHLSQAPDAIKLDPELSSEAIPEHCLDGKGNITLDLVFAPDLSPEEMAFLRDQLDGEIVKFKPQFQTITLKTELEKVPELVDVPGLEAAMPTEMEPYADGEKAVIQHKAGRFLANVPGLQAYTGEGVTISIGDLSRVLDHIDWNERVKNNTSVNSNDHAEMVAGVAAGNGNLDPLAIGHAPEADLEIYRKYRDIENMPAPYNDDGVRVTIHSLAQRCNGIYSAGSRETDRTMYNNPELLHVFSAGNEGRRDCDFGAGEHWGTISGGRKIAKNCITVGSVDDRDKLSEFSSRGPTSDWRLKPDLVAGGERIRTTLQGNRYGGPNGTSVSAPAVGGVLATMIEAWRIHNPTLPAYNGVMKAALLNSADDLGNRGPDYKFGYGRLNADRALSVIEEGRWFQDTINSSTFPAINLTVPSGVKEMKVMLVWIDKQKQPSRSTTDLALQNDLDLKMTDPNSQVFRPWILETSTATASALNAPATRGIDSRNTVEQITVFEPDAGNWSVEVSANILTTPEQRFALVYEYLYDTVHLAYPRGGESWVPGEEVKIHWDAWTNSGTFDIEYSPNGTNWTSLESGIAADKRAKNVNVPSGVSGKIWVRVRRGSDEDISATQVNVIDVPEVELEWSCIDSFQISWPPVSGATGYEVFVLDAGDEAMESEVTTTDTSHRFYYWGTPTKWVSVRALGPNGLVGRRSYAKKREGTIRCPDMTPQAGFTANKVNVCTGATVTFTDSSYAGLVQNYYWDFGLGAQPRFAYTAGPHTVTYPTAGQYQVIQYVTSQYGTDYEIRPDFIRVVDFVTPTISISADPQPGCEGQEVNIISTTEDEGLNPMFEWRLNGTIMDTTDTGNRTFSGLKDGNVLRVRMTSSRACKTADSAVSNVLTLSMQTPVVPTVGISISPQPSCPGDLLTLTAWSNIPSAYEYQWFMNDVLLPGVTGVLQSTTALVPGDEVFVRVRIPDDECVTATTAESPVETIKPGSGCTTPKTLPAPLSDIMVYPNPFSEGIRVRLESPQAQATLRLFDMTGRQIASCVVQSDELWKIGEKVPAGAYRLEVQYDGKREGFRIIKTH